MTTLAPRKKTITPVLPLAIKQDVWNRVGYVPSVEALPFHESEAHERYLQGGWRAGKSYVPAMEVLPYPIWWQNKQRTDGLMGLMWIVGVEYADCQPEFTVLHENLKKLGYVNGKASMPQEGRWSLKTTTGWLIETLSSKDLAALGGWTVDVILVVEAGRQDKGVRLWALGRVMEVHGPVIFSGTLERGNAWYREKQDEYPSYPNDDDVHVISLPTWSNPVFEGENDAYLQDIKRKIPHNEWLERFCGIKAKASEVVFPEFMRRPEEVKGLDKDRREITLSRGKICHVTDAAEYDPNLEVELFVDPGEVYSVAMGQFVTLQQTRLDTRKPTLVTGLFIFDEIYIEHGWFDEVRDELKKYPWFKPRLVTYHDRATAQHHNQKSQGDLWIEPIADGGLEAIVNYTPRVLGVLDGISIMHRWLLNRLTGEPLIYYHPRCKNAIKEFSLEKFPRNRDTGSQKINPIDRHNHLRKAVCYGLYHKFRMYLPLEERAMNEAMKHNSTFNRRAL